MKQKVRMAYLVVDILHKRCKKWRREGFQATGITDKEAIAKALEKMELRIADCRGAHFPSPIETQEAEIEDFGSYTTLGYDMFPKEKIYHQQPISFGESP